MFPSGQNHLRFSLATASDQEAIARLHAQSWKLHYRGSFPDEYLDHQVLDDRREVWKKRLESPPLNQRVYMAKKDGHLCGFCCLYLEEDDQWGSLLDNIHIDPKQAGRGIGSALMQKAAECINHHCPQSPMYLLVLEKNQAAQRFYEKLGGTKVESLFASTPGGGKQSSLDTTGTLPSVSPFNSQASNFFSNY